MAPPGITVCLSKDPDAAGAAHILSYCGQKFRDLKLQCLQQRCLFTDTYFGARPESVGYGELGPSSAVTKRLVWKRPKDICKPRPPRFIHGGTTRFDVCQGKYLGDCWFLAAAASLTLHPHLLHRVVPQDQSFDSEDYAGIFHFQFWQYGQWVDVVVDDLLPTVDGELFFVHSAERDEFWMPLLEKAYAKLNGSYEAMSGGYMNEAFVDFTGGIGEALPLKAPNRGLFKSIQAALSRHSLMGAFIQVSSHQDRELQTAEGLVKGHAYSITGIHKLELEGKKVRLLRLRNPWGFQEWNGRWSDNSPLWSNLDPVLQTKLCANREDGEFWMQLVDFIHYFDTLEICHLNAVVQEDAPSSWDINCFQGRWVRGHTAGGHQSFYPWDTFWMNPQYHVSLLEPDEAELKKQHRKERRAQIPTCTLLVSLMQRDQRRSRWRGKDFLLIAFNVFQVPKQYLELKTTAHRRELLPRLKAVCPLVWGYSRDITGHLKLPPGDYLIIPSTQKPMEEASFTLRIFTEKKHQFLEIDDEISMEEKTLQVMAPPRTGLDQVLEETFLEWAGQDQQVGTMELQGLLNRTMSTLSQLKTGDFSTEDCLKIIQCFSDGGTGRLTLREFKQVWIKMEEWEGIFVKYDLDRSGTMNAHEMQLALNAAGFHLNKQTTEVLLKKYSNPWLQIDFSSFMSFMVRLERIFRHCKSQDVNGDGLIYMTQKEWMELSTSC
ncbi:calpain-12 [Tiliqua scincoides]|uniref:calpain-12 n=1 Tax=Tiliqua scincoides TaxID=71010 RepID=UPI0034627113